MNPRALYNTRRKRMRPRRSVSLGTALLLLAQAVLVAVGAMAMAGCDGNAVGCSPTDLSSANGSGQQAASAAGPAQAGVANNSAVGQVRAGNSWSAPASKPASASQLPGSATVTLPTGDRISVTSTSAGGVSLTPLAPSGRSASSGPAQFVRLGLGADQYLIPDKAVPFLGSVLDPRLFDVSYLARAVLASGGNIPLTLTYSGATAPSLPGIRIAHAAGGTASATLIAGQAAKFGQLLTAQSHARQAGLPGVTRISLAQVPGGPPVPAAPAEAPAATAGPSKNAPHYHTLTVKFSGVSSQATEVGIVQNVGDARLGTYLIMPQLNPLVLPLHGVDGPGPFSFSVPDGTYSLMFSVLTPHMGTVTDDDAALLAQPQINISSDQTVTLDASTAKPYQASLATPVTASARVDQLNFWRESTTGGGCGGPHTASIGMGLYSQSGPAVSGYGGNTPAQLSATPTSPVTQGYFGFDANSALETGPVGADQSAPGYYLDFPNPDRIPASLTYTVADKDLTTVHSQLYASPVGGSGQLLMLYPRLYTPWGFQDLGYDTGSGGPQLQPGERTDYWYSSDPTMDVWQGVYGDTFGQDSSGNAVCNNAKLLADGPMRQISPGQTITETWNKAPLTWTSGSDTVGQATVPDDLPRTEAYITAARQDDNGVLNLQVGDSDPAHGFNWDDVQDTATIEGPYGPADIAVYRNGALITTPGQEARQLILAQLPVGLDVPLLSQPATYQIDLDGTAASCDGAAMTTDWTFHSSASDPSASLPATQACPIDPSRGCSFLPLLFLNYDLPQLNYDGQATAGQPFTVTFTAAHQQHESAPSGVSATVSVSFDDGKTWTTPVNASSQGNNQFTATIQQPALSATSGFVSLRIHAQDGAGNSVDQTIIRAYGLTS